MTASYFVRPLDSISPRGHRLFGDPGSLGEADMPPAPSVFTGAFKSALVGRDPLTLAAFDGRASHPDPAVTAVVGMPRQTSGRVTVEPGSLRLAHLCLARRLPGDRIEGLHALPADLVVVDRGRSGPTVHPLRPALPAEGMAASTLLPRLPVLQAPRGKPRPGYWLTDEGLRDYLAGILPGADRLVRSADLWGREFRPGIGLDGETRTARDGALFTSEHITLHDGVGFLVGFSGDHGQLGDDGLLRLAGDGRAAVWSRVEWLVPEPPAQFATARRFKVVMKTPGIFSSGWLPDGILRDGEAFQLRLPGCRARLVAAAIPRHELVSGWDLARWAPKPARRAVPAGSVYWFDDLEGDRAALEGAFGEGLWGEVPDPVRRSEGYNLCQIACWPDD